MKKIVFLSLLILTVSTDVSANPFPNIYGNRIIPEQQNQLPVIKSNVSTISVRDGDILKINQWRLTPEAKPDVYIAGLINGESHRVTFITDVDSISFMVDVGKTYDFIVQWGDKACYTQILGQRFIPAADFDEAYQESHRGKTFVQIPQVYELINIAISTTPFSKGNSNFVYKKTEYYTRVSEWFDKHQDHTLVFKLDSILSKNSGYYGTFKMNGNAFLFNDNGDIIRSDIYDRTGFRNERNNSLLPYMDLMQSFADESNFLEFYKQNIETYEAQIAFYRDTAGIKEMKRWLYQNFPGATSYDTYNIVFSPLVAFNQSTTWFESNGFTELQPHVNFPYLRQFKNLQPISKQGENIYRGNIVFTELNHGFINPEGDKYASSVMEAISNRNTWIDSTRSSNYYGGNGVFHEYMNWGLVSLRIVDYVSSEEQDIMLARVVRMMVKYRGFIKFKEYNDFLINLYINRGDGVTLADLYPEIIAWFEKNN